MVSKWQELQDQQSETAGSLAELVSGFPEQVAGLRTAMEDGVEGMSLPDKAQESARSTIQAFIDEAANMLPVVQQAYADLGQTAANALGLDLHYTSRGHSGDAGDHLAAYASGVSNAPPGWAWVGEEGPELVNFGGGEVVYTATETSNILARGNDNKDFYVSPPEETEGNGDSGEKTVVLRIEGAGEMKVSGGGANKEDIVNVLVENMKGVLMDILRQEIMEEGEMSYEF